MDILSGGKVFGLPANVVLALLVLLFLFLLFRRGGTKGAPPNDVADPKRQLEFVSRVAFETQPLLNKSEFQVLGVLDGVVRDFPSYRVMAQTSLGEFIKPKPGLSSNDNDLAYRSINSKRADFVIFDRFGYAAVVVEYQGSGHYQGTAALRDAVKKEAFRTAGIALIEVPARYDRAEVAKQVRQVMERVSTLSRRSSA
jgi:hypothetical protein